MNFFKTAARPRMSPESDAEAASRIYAIGDIHGRLDLYDKLSSIIADDLRAHPAAQASAVFLGDYIDRGPQSYGVIDRLAKGQFAIPFVALRGNHEAVVIEFLEDESRLDEWRHYGGLETLTSYGVDVREAMRGRGFAQTREAFLKRAPREHIDFFMRTQLGHAQGNYFFAHAGVRPNVPLAAQEERDLLWIRGAFLDHRGPFEKVVVHGHTPKEEPENLPNRINVDTGAYATGKLTCVVLDGDRRRFLST